MSTSKDFNEYMQQYLNNLGIHWDSTAPEFQIPQDVNVSEHISQVANEFVLYWFGHVLGDRVPFTEMDKNIVEMILSKMSRGQPNPYDLSTNNAIAALCAGILRQTAAILPMVEIMRIAFHAGKCYGEIYIEWQKRQE